MSSNQVIDTIIFDLGNVLLDIDYSETVQAFRSLGLSNPEQAFTNEIQSTVFQQYEKGLISNEDFLNELRVYMPEAERGEIVNAWNALLGEFPIHRYHFLKSLQGKYKCYILSNTNALHQEAFERTIDQTAGWNQFASLFEFIGYSHQMHERKPDEAIFQKLIAENGIRAENACFVDDTLMHVEAARRLGITSFHLLDGEEVEDVLKREGVVSTTSF